MTRNIADSVVVVTGASAGVGRAIAHAFAQRGCKLGLIARSEEALLDVLKEVEELGGVGAVATADVADYEAVFSAAKLIEDQLGPIDVWVNNAMVSVFSPISEMRPEEYKRVTDVTYLGYVYGTMAALRSMKPRNSGSIIQVGSALAYRSIPLQSAYCAAKHAMKGFTESLLTELIHDRSAIKVSMVHLPAINTPQFDWSRSRMPNQAQPVPPIFQPEVPAEAVVWAAEHGPRELNIGYPVYKARLGEAVVPGYVDHYLAEHGYDSQQTDEPRGERPDNLWEPMPREYYKTHGRFDDTAKRVSWAWELRRNAIPLSATTAAIAAGFFAMQFVQSFARRRHQS